MICVPYPAAADFKNQRFKVSTLITRSSLSLVSTQQSLAALLTSRIKSKIQSWSYVTISTIAAGGRDEGFQRC
ncbi:hypothetical protein ACET3Z_029654 [Daucus carota]